MSISTERRARAPQFLIRILLCFAALYAAQASAQLTGTKNIPGDYADLAAAIADLNTVGVGAGGVTLNVVAANPQSAPVGGYAITATGTAANPIALQGNGNTITASGALVAGTLTDAIIKLIGSDFVTIRGFTLTENPANTVTAPATNTMTEWGIALLVASTTDGAQNNLIEGNTITLNKTYLNTWGVYSNTRHSATVVGTTADIANNTTAPNSNNRVYTNNISNVNMGIAFIGSGVAANQDVGNDIGGTTPATGNNLTNWGGAAAASTYVSNSGTSYGIYANHQTSLNISRNTLISATASGTAVTFRGILSDFTVAAPVGTFTNNITNNTLTLTSAFASGAFEVVRQSSVAAAAGVTVNLSNNRVLNCAVTGVASASGLFGVANTAAFANVNIENNVLEGNTSTATTGGFVGVTNQGAATGVINIRNNLIGTASAPAITFSAATSGVFNGATNTQGAVGSTLNMDGNDIRGIVQSVVGTNAHLYYSNSNANVTTNINNNTFTNITANTTGNVTFISNSVTHIANTVHNVNNNRVVTGYSKSGAGGTVLFYNAFGSSPATVTETNTGNDFSNLTFTGLTIVTGWRGADGAVAGGSRKTVSNNTFTNISNGTGSTQALYVGFSDPTFANNNVSNNVIRNVSGGGAVIGIFSDGQNQNFFNNSISGLTTTGAAAVSGMSFTGATVQNVFKNRIYNLEANNAGGVVNGILANGGTTFNIFNNLIGDLRAPASNLANAINGLNLTTGAATSSFNVSYNTIAFAATSSGALFGTSGILHTANATATIGTLNARNNIIVNNSVPSGAGLTVAMRRTGVALDNYGAVSNNNDFYAGTPGGSNLIFSDGTNSDQTLAAYQTRVATRDSASITTNPSFASLVGNAPNFLHIDTSIATPLDGAGTPVAGITDDFDGDARNATTPDIGADEFDLVGNLTIAPTTVDFGNQDIGTTGGPLTVTLTNTGAGSLNVTALTVPSAPFARTGGTCSPTVPFALGSGANCTLFYTFSPSVTGPASEILTVNASAPGGGTITLQGNGTAPMADLSITKTNGTDDVQTGAPVTYTITASNAGPNAVTGAVVTDAFPSDLTGCTWTCVAVGGSCTAAGGPNISDSVNLSVGGSATYTATCTVATTSLNSSLANTATIAVPVPMVDPTPGNNTATDTDNLQRLVDLSVTKTDGATAEIAGTPVSYTITVGNAGPNVAQGTAVDTFGASLTGCSWTCAATNGTCTASGSGSISDGISINSGGQLVYTANCTVAPAATGSLVNTASAAVLNTSYFETDPANNSATDTDTLSSQGDFSVTITDNRQYVQVGETLNYVIVVGNSGPSAGTANVSDVLPGELNAGSWVCIPFGGATCSNGAGSTLSDAPTLPPGSQVGYVFSTTVANAGGDDQIDNSAGVTATGGFTDTNATNNNAVDAPADTVVIFKHGFESAPLTLIDLVGANDFAQAQLTLSREWIDRAGMVPTVLFQGQGNKNVLFSVELVRLGDDLALRVLTRDAQGREERTAWQRADLANSMIDFAWQSAATTNAEGYLQIHVGSIAAATIDRLRETESLVRLRVFLDKDGVPAARLIH